VVEKLQALPLGPFAIGQFGVSHRPCAVDARDGAEQNPQIRPEGQRPHDADDVAGKDLLEARPDRKQREHEDAEERPPDERSPAAVPDPYVVGSVHGEDHPRCDEREHDVRENLESGPADAPGEALERDVEASQCGQRDPDADDDHHPLTGRSRDRHTPH